MLLFSRGSFSQILIGLAVRLFIIFAILPVHEFAHAFAAYKLGDPTAKNRGRMTLNPMAHLDVMGALCLIIVGFGWAKPVPVNTYNFDNQRQRQRGMAITAAAGPLSNLIVAIVSLIILRIIACFAIGPVASDNIETVFMFIMTINVALAIFNLVPIPPLDGSNILNWLLPDKWVYWLDQNSRILSMLLIAVVFMGALDIPISFMSNLIYRGVWGGADWLFNLAGLPEQWSAIAM